MPTQTPTPASQLDLPQAAATPDRPWQIFWQAVTPEPGTHLELVPSGFQFASQAAAQQFAALAELPADAAWGIGQTATDLVQSSAFCQAWAIHAPQVVDGELWRDATLTRILANQRAVYTVTLATATGRLTLIPAWQREQLTPQRSRYRLVWTAPDLAGPIDLSRFVVMNNGRPAMQRQKFLGLYPELVEAWRACRPLGANSDLVAELYGLTGQLEADHATAAQGCARTLFLPAPEMAPLRLTTGRYCLHSRRRTQDRLDVAGALYFAAAEPALAAAALVSNPLWNVVDTKASAELATSPALHRLDQKAARGSEGWRRAIASRELPTVWPSRELATPAGTWRLESRLWPVMRGLETYGDKGLRRTSQAIAPDGAIVELEPPPKERYHSNRYGSAGDQYKAYESKYPALAAALAATGTTDSLAEALKKLHARSAHWETYFKALGEKAALSRHHPRWGRLKPVWHDRLQALMAELAPLNPAGLKGHRPGCCGDDALTEAILKLLFTEDPHISSYATLGLAKERHSACDCQILAYLERDGRPRPLAIQEEP